MKQPIRLKVNGEEYDFQVDPSQTLLEVLRENLKLVKTKEGCGVGECGSCAVLMNRKAVNSCLVLAVDADGKEILTSEGLAEDVEYHPFNEALIDRGSMRVSFEPPGSKSQQEFFTFCHVCPGHCSVKATVEDGRVVDISPDKESGLPNELCPVKKGRFSIPEVLHHPDRLKYPLRRVGARGEGKWERISWEEALDTISGKLLELKAAHGPESVAFGLGEPKGLEFAFAQRLASVFGTPNVVTPGWCCGIPSGMASALTYGWNCVPDEEHPPKLLVLWAVNNNHTSGGIRRETFERAIQSGTKLVVVDPRKIDTASFADLWVRLRPGSDGALAMGLLKVIVDEELYDREFVETWCLGFDRLVEELRTFTLGDVEELTWVPQETIREFARLYAGTKPASIQWGNALDTSAISFPAAKAVAILRALTANLNVPGGEMFLTPAPYLRPGKFFLLSKFPRVPGRSVGGDFKLALRSAFVPPHSFVNSVLTGEPYRIRAGLFLLTNPILSYPDAKRTYEAFLKLEFTVVSELFMTPTAALADIVLPAAWGMEHEELGYWPGWYEEIRAYPKLVDPPGEAWADTKWLNELAKRLGLGEYFWERDDDALEEWLEPSGFTYEEMKRKRVLHSKREYRKNDYRTPTGKIEIYSERAAEFGYSPLPYWKEVSSLPPLTDEYPLIMTNAKEDVYMLTGYKHVASLRSMKPEPMVEMHPDTARRLNLNEGEKVRIATGKGGITQRLALDDTLDPRTVVTSFGWWFPEDRSPLSGWDRSNINVLTRSEPPYDPGVGTVDLRGIPCRICRAEG
ncbi:MAG: molybdopterin-dependent oxidoreductase [Deltaproteobacteria bacterium]|nr:molybdopterin-dependent oxidoreductase [Deltaproteobacteria bacterium]